MLGVDYGRGDGAKSVNADCNKIENRRSAADDIHGQVKVTNLCWKSPLPPVKLQKGIAQLFLNFIETGNFLGSSMVQIRTTDSSLC